MGLSVCLFLLQLASSMFIRPSNDTTYPAGHVVRHFCTNFSENSPLQSWGAFIIVQQCASRPILLCDMYARAHNKRCTYAVLFARGVIGHFCLEFVSCYVFVLLIMPPNKVCPQCEAVVPPRKEQGRKFRVPLHYCTDGLVALQCFLV